MSKQKGRRLPDEQNDFFKGKTFTLKGHMMFPNLLKAVENQYKPYPVFNMELVADDEDAKTQEAIKAINGAVKAYKDKFYEGKELQNWHEPVKNYETWRNGDGEKAHPRLQGKQWLKPWAKAEFPPSVFDVNKKKVTDDAELVNGRHCLFHMGLYPFEQGINKGVGIRMIAVVVLSGSAEMGEQVDPDVAFAGFEGEFNQAEHGRQALEDM